MVRKTSIEWTDYNWNFLRGCSRVSEGCRNCYAEKIAGRFSGEGMAYHGLATMNGEARWTGEIKFYEDILLEPLKWKKPRRVFVNSMSDLFHEKVQDDWLDKAFAVMALTPQHTYQILTKRLERMKEYFESRDGEPFNTATARIMTQIFSILSQIKAPLKKWQELVVAGHFVEIEHEVFWFKNWPLPNVWLGVSCEDQKTADERIPLLLETPAAIRWISAEPLLGPIDLSKFLHSYLASRFEQASAPIDQSLDWIVVGGESGAAARPMHPLWAEAIRDQCLAAEVPFFFKQWGEWGIANVHAGGDLGGDIRRGFTEIVHGIPREHDGHYRQYDEWMSRYGKKKSGRELDGREWNEFPKI